MSRHGGALQGAGDADKVGAEGGVWGGEGRSGMTFEQSVILLFVVLSLQLFVVHCRVDKILRKLDERGGEA